MVTLKQVKLPRPFLKLIWWYVGFLIALISFISIIQIQFERPAIYNQLNTLNLIIQKQTDTGYVTQTTFGTNDTIKTIITYTGAKQGTKVLLVMARLTTIPSVTNSRQIIAQREVVLSGVDGKKLYDFPAFERVAGNYEITLQSGGMIVSKQPISLK